ncbi:MAG: outer membrane protein [Devosia sp.]
MRKALLAATALVGSVIFLVPGAQAFDWNGRYVGGVVSIVKSTGSIDWSFDDLLGEAASGTFSFDGVGALAGLTAGFNYRLDDKLVIGIEGDASVAFLKDSGTEDGGFWTAEFEEELQSLLTLRGRLGVLTNDTNTLFYVTGGLAGGQVKASALLVDEFPLDEEEEPTAARMSGFVVGIIGGIGVEHAIRDNLTVKAEVLGYTLGSLSGDGFAGKGDSTATYHPSGFIFRTGLNFHF